jgi:hypothetical protein
MLKQDDTFSQQEYKKWLVLKSLKPSQFVEGHLSTDMAS